MSICLCLTSLNKGSIQGSSHLHTRFSPLVAARELILSLKLNKPIRTQHVALVLIKIKEGADDITLCFCMQLKFRRFTNFNALLISYIFYIDPYCSLSLSGETVTQTETMEKSQPLKAASETASPTSSCCRIRSRFHRLLVTAAIALSTISICLLYGPQYLNNAGILNSSESISVDETLEIDDFKHLGAEEPSSNRVPLEAHIMSKCPDAQYCLRNLVVPAMEQIHDKVDFSLSFIGRSYSPAKSVRVSHDNPS